MVNTKKTDIVTQTSKNGQNKRCIVNLPTEQSSVEDTMCGKIDTIKIAILIISVSTAMASVCILCVKTESVIK